MAIGMIKTSLQSIVDLLGFLIGNMSDVSQLAASRVDAKLSSWLPWKTSTNVAIAVAVWL